MPRVVLPEPGQSVAVTTRSLRGTRSLATRLARELTGGAVLALSGDLGAGKTSFVQGLAAGLEVAELAQVLSPTYTLVNEYPGGRLLLLHLDLYRLKSAEAARDLGLEEQIGRADAVTAIEWADLIPELVPDGALWVRLERTGHASRRVELRLQAR